MQAQLCYVRHFRLWWVKGLRVNPSFFFFFLNSDPSTFNQIASAEPWIEETGYFFF